MAKPTCSPVRMHADRCHVQHTSARQGITWDSSKQPRAGVTSFMLTTCSSTGGMVAPDPWLPTWVNPPMVCSLMLAKFCKVRPCGRNASTTFRNRRIVSDEA